MIALDAPRHISRVERITGRRARFHVYYLDSRGHSRLSPVFPDQAEDPEQAWETVLAALHELRQLRSGPAALVRVVELDQSIKVD